MKKMTLEQLQEPQSLRLAMGELNANELRVAQAAVRYAHFHLIEAAKSGMMDGPIVIEEVGRVEFDGTGELDINWSIEGGIHELGPGTILLITDRKVTDDGGYGEVYVASNPEKA